MKDAYSFHLSQESLQETYNTMYQAYSTIFTRMGLKYRAVEADTGAIGGSASHEFQVLADSGEDLIFYSNASTYAANIEQATSLRPVKATLKPSTLLHCIDTPEQKTIDEVSTYLNISPEQTIKTLLVKGKEQPLVALVLKGNDELNEIKAMKHPLVDSPLTFIDEDCIEKILNVGVGSLGPVDLGLPIIVDYHALALASFTCGANQNQKHYMHAQWDRDVKEYQTFDLRKVQEGDASPDGIGTLHSCRGIEVGHVFQLGDKYAKAMNATVINEQGQLQTMMMGCYGLGLTRVVAAAIEQHHDELGIIWPEALAPFSLVIIPINGHKSITVMEQASQLYKQLIQRNMDVLLDDRNERPGVLFADHDLIGIPHRLVVSERNLEQGCVEYKSRASGETQQIPLTALTAFINKLLNIN
jgi:prolyl-tRNA synthetase